PGRIAVPVSRAQLAGHACARRARALGVLAPRPVGARLGPGRSGPGGVRGRAGRAARRPRRRTGQAGPARCAGRLARSHPAAMSAYFSPKSFAFLRGLARHNERAWFQEHKADYEAHVRGPFLRLVADLQPALADISPHYRADPRPQGGTLFRIHRDTRFAHDKSPYKSWQGARLFHYRRREDAAPSFYLHLEPGASFVGAGLWHPETHTQRKVRQFIFENPGAWSRAVHAPAFRRRYTLGS